MLFIIFFLNDEAKKNSEIKTKRIQFLKNIIKNIKINE